MPRPRQILLLVAGVMLAAAVARWRNGGRAAEFDSSECSVSECGADGVPLSLYAG